MDTSNLISKAQFARDHQVSRQWIEQLIKDDRLLAIKIGGHILIEKNAKIKRRVKA